MCRALLTCATLLLFTSSSRAEEVKIAETFWQRLPGVGWVDFDPDFNPVFHLEDGYYFAKTNTFVKYRDSGPTAPAWFDRAGRAWVKDGADATHLWTGEKWEKLPFAVQGLFEDAAGRVFVFDGTSVRVRAKDGKWTEQELKKTAGSRFVGFAEGGGRVWVWAWGHKEYTQDVGAWSLADGKWKHHVIKNGFHFHTVHCVYPMADGRVLLLDYQPPGHGRSPPYYWHPDKKLTPAEMVVSDGKLAGSPYELAYGTDGTLYFGATADERSAWLAFDAKGKLHEVPQRNPYLAGVPMAVVNGRRAVFTKLGDTPPVLPSGDGEFLGADRAGRFYFRPSYTGWKGYERRVPVTVVWPKHEKPGDVLTVEKEKVQVVGMVKDEVGKLWAQPVASGALWQWHGGKWIDTPVQALFHPVWTARPASPWSQWTWNSAHLVRLHGKNGSVLVVRIRDVYQLDEPPKDGDRFPPRVVNDPAFPHPAPPPPVARGGEKPLYWLEAYLFRGGKWTGPTEVRKLLATESAALLADFPTTSGERSFFALVNDGTRLWATFDGKVVTADKSGKVIEADWPLAKPKNPLPFAMFSLLPNEKVLLAGAHTLSLSEGKIVAKALATPGDLPPATAPAEWGHWKLAKDGTLWYYTTGVSNTDVKVWHFRAGKWAVKSGVGLPLHEDANGDVWCLSEPRGAGKLLVVNGKETKEVAFAPDDMRLGFTDVPKGAVVWAQGDRLYCLEPGAKPVLRWRLLTESVPGVAPAVIDDKGAVLLGGLRGSLNSPKP